MKTIRKVSIFKVAAIAFMAAGCLVSCNQNTQNGPTVNEMQTRLNDIMKEYQEMQATCDDYTRQLAEKDSSIQAQAAEIQRLINQLNEKGVEFKSLKEGDIDTTTPTGKLVFSIFASLAEFERETIRQRQAEGIAIAKANGVYKGRVRKDINRNEFLSLYNKWQSKEITKEYMRKKLNVSLSTLDRRIAQYRKTGE